MAESTLQLLVELLVLGHWGGVAWVGLCWVGLESAWRALGERLESFWRALGDAWRALGLGSDWLGLGRTPWLAPV